jgi:hypothetical protein
MYALFHFLVDNSAGIGPTSLIKDFNDANCKIGDKVLVKWGNRSKKYVAKVIEFGGE